MTTVKEVLKEAKFSEWPEAEQLALCNMMGNISRGKTVGSVGNQTPRTRETLIALLNRQGTPNNTAIIDEV